MIDDISIESEEDGFHLILSGDLSDAIEGYERSCRGGGYSMDIRLPQEIAWKLVDQVRPIVEWRGEGEEARAMIGGVEWQEWKERVWPERP